MTSTPRRFQFKDAFEPCYAEVVDLSHGVRRITACNPGPFARWGTNTFILGHGQDVAVIDPGPDTEAHHTALTAALGGARVKAVFVSHEHPDHSPLGFRLAAEHGADLVMGQPTGAGRPAQMPDPMPAITLVSGAPQMFTGPDWQVVALPTPGHAWGHLCFAMPDAQVLFSGDHVMAWAMPHISPPEGDMDAYLDSLEALIHAGYGHLFPAHGPDVAEASALLHTCKAHRLAREAQVQSALRRGPLAIPDIVADIYGGLEPELRSAAGKTVLAHLLRLERQGRAQPVEGLWKAA